MGGDSRGMERRRTPLQNATYQYYTADVDRWLQYVYSDIKKAMHFPSARLEPWSSRKE